MINDRVTCPDCKATLGWTVMALRRRIVLVRPVHSCKELSTGERLYRELVAKLGHEAVARDYAFCIPPEKR